MPHCIGDFILRGELRNTRANAVFGWLEFAPDYGLHIELTGNLSGQLQGKHIRFSTSRVAATPSDATVDLPPVIEGLADRQIGVIGEVILKQVRVPTIPLPDYTRLNATEQLQCSVEKTCLAMEWFSQNGQVQAEIIDPQLEFVDQAQADDSEPPEFESLGDGLSSGVAEAYLDVEGGHVEPIGFDAEEDDDDDDPYGLFDPDLQRDVSEALGGETEFQDEFDSETPSGTDPLLDDPANRQKRSWDEVIPGLDPETKAMYEQWDEIFEGEKDEPVAYLFETPLRLPPPNRVTTDEEAQGLVVSILAQLALLSVAVDVCEHYSPLQTYRLLMTEILPTAKVHPNLAASRMVQHYSTSDYCDSCDAEFDGAYDAGDYDPDEHNPEPDNPEENDSEQNDQ